MPKAQTLHTNVIVCHSKQGTERTGEKRRTRDGGGRMDDTCDKKSVAALGVTQSADVNDRKTGTWFSSPKNDEHRL